jgi:hypothetical protein
MSDRELITYLRTDLGGTLKMVVYLISYSVKKLCALQKLRRQPPAHPRFLPYLPGYTDLLHVIRQ